MDSVGEVALWLAVVVCSWTVVTALFGAGRDVRLLASGARGLHAAAALALLAVASRVGETFVSLSEAPAGISSAIAVREIWADPATRLAMWAGITACFAAVVPRVVRHSDRPVRTGAQLVAAGVVLAMLLAAAGARLVLPVSAEDGPGAPVAVHVWAGVLARLLLVSGCGAMIVPFALIGAPVRREISRRWSLAALGLVIAGLTLSAWVRYAAAAPASMIDASGLPTGHAWTSLDALWALPALLVGAAAYWLADSTSTASGSAPLYARRPANRWMTGLLLALVAIAVAAVLVPPVLDWTNARAIEVGFALLPPAMTVVAIPTLLAVLAVLVGHLQAGGGLTLADAAAALAGAAVLGGAAWIAGVAEATVLFAVLVAGTTAGMLLAQVRHAGGLRRRSSWVAQAAALVGVAAGLGAVSQRARDVDVAPGAPAVVDIRGREWRLSSQGVSQDETPAYDGILVGFDVRTPGGGSQFVTAGERRYRDAHGHGATRVSRPGFVHMAAGDVRIVVHAIRDEVARVQVQHHPLVSLAWLAGVLTVLALLVAALAPTGRAAGIGGEAPR